MKNIHVLPTEKPTWLHKSILTGVLRKSSSCIDDMKQAQGMNIYITSDEEIKEGDQILLPSKKIYKMSNTDMIHYLESESKSTKKIILTDNKDLIKDGVQAIDDEFLEWFVNNPSCEEVKILRCPIEGTYTLDTPKQELKKNFYCGDEVDYDDKCIEQCVQCVNATGVDYGYLPDQGTKQVWQSLDKSINGNLSITSNGFWRDVPKEEQNQNIIDMMKGDEELGLYDEILPQQIWNEEKKEGIKQLIQDHKKETLEEAGVAYAKTVDQNHTSHMLGFLNGAKWQKDQYTIEEQHIERSIGELEKEYIKGFNDGSKRQQDKICDSEVLQRIRASKSDAEARRIIRTI